MSFEPVALHDSLDRLVRGLHGGQEGATSMGSLFSRWTEAVGSAVAAHAKPVKLDQGRLLVEVDEPGWATQLRFLERTVIERLKSVADIDVTRFEVRVKRS